MDKIYHVSKKVANYGIDILHSKGMALEKKLIQHGRVSVYQHSFGVACMSLMIADKLGKFHVKTDKRSLVRGALLHDYFLYDWHDKPVRNVPLLEMHGFTHAGTALKNALQDFKLNPREKDIISKHMFPLNITPPSCREAAIVCCADKICAICETFGINYMKFM